MDEEKLGVLLISGARTHQEMYAAGFAADPRCRLIGLTDELDVPSERRLWNAQLAQTFDLPVLDDMDAALERSDVHIVSICAEPERRARIAAKCARAGKHVYVDKPLGCNLGDVQDLCDAVAQHHVKSHMFSLVRMPWSQRAKRLVESDALGELKAVHCDLLFAKGPAGTIPKLQPRTEKYPPPQFTFVDSKREVYTTAIYSVAFLCWLTHRRATRVGGATANYFFAEHLRNDVEDFGTLLIEFEGGLSATVTAGRIGWSSHPDFGPMQTVLIGSKDSMLVDAYSPRLEVFDDKPPWQAPRRNPDDPMGFWGSTQQSVGAMSKQQFLEVSEPEPTVSDQSYFVDCIICDRPSDVSVSLAAHATRVLFAAYESAALGRPVDVPDPEP